MEIAVSRHLDLFNNPDGLFEGMDAQALALALTCASDVTLVLDKDGVVLDLSFGSEDLFSEGFAAWRGLPWIDTVHADSRHKIEEMLRDAAMQLPTRWREVNHPSAGNDDVPIRYSTIKVLKDGGLLAFGRDLRSVAALQQRLMDAQASVERDYARIRQTELRYRLLFQMISEPVVVIEAQSGKVVDANPAALSAIGLQQNKITNLTLANLFDPRHADEINNFLTTARTAGNSDAGILKLADNQKEFFVSASLFRQAGGANILVRFASTTGSEGVIAENARRPALSKVIEQLPDGFVVTDPNARILTANAAFLDLVQLATEDQVRGQTIDRWIGRSSVDVNALTSSLREHGSITAFATVATGAFGGVEEVDISAVAALNAEPPCLGFVIRRQKAQGLPAQRLPKSVEQLTELVGRVPLKDLVRETSDLIEKLCIEAALQLSGDNRASAAEMLGLSRQSLYVKLRRFGLGDLGQETAVE